MVGIKKTYNHETKSQSNQHGQCNAAKKALEALGRVPAGVAGDCRLDGGGGLQYFRFSSIQTRLHGFAVFRLRARQSQGDSRRRSFVNPSSRMLTGIPRPASRAATPLNWLFDALGG